MPRLTNDPDHDWERFGRSDPYFAVLSLPQYHGRLGTAEREAFFRSGVEHVERVLAIVRSRLDPAFTPRRALDFGCGVGRVVRPLAERCEQVVGVDVAQAMLDEARRNCDAAGISNVDLVIGDDRLSRVEGTFDFVHSYIVLQHVPTERGEALIAELARRLAPGGVAVVHVTYALARQAPWRRALYWARTRVPGAHWALNVLLGRHPRSPVMQSNTYSLTRVLDVLLRHGCQDVHVRFSDHQGHRGALLFARREQVGLFV